MACNNCSETSIQFECGDSPRLICVRSATDPTPIPAWAVPVCVAGVVTTVTLYSNEAATDRLVGYTLADRVPCPTDMRGTSCEGSLKTDLCAATMTPLLDTIQSVGEEIETAIATQTSAIQSTVESVGEEIERAIETSVAGYNSAGAALPANFNSLAQTLNYTGGNLTSIVKTNGVNTWTQTFTYTGDNVTGISAWVQS